MRCPLDRAPRRIEMLKPAVGGRFVAHTPPDALLGIQRRLIGRQILQVEPTMGRQEAPDDVAPMPTGAIDVQPQPIPSEPPAQVPEHQHEALPVPFGGSHEPVPSQQRRHPSREIEPLMMLAGRGNPQPRAPKGPPSPKARMQGKARFILKDDGLARSQGLEFFLTDAGTAWHRPSAPAGTHDWPASDETPTGASTSGLAAPSSRCQTPASSAPPVWAHPTAPAAAQRPGATAPAAAPADGEGRASVGPGGRDGAWASSSARPRRSARASTGSSSSESHPARPRSNWDAALPGPTRGRQSSGRSAPQGSPWRWPPSVPGWPRGASTLTSGVSCRQGIIGRLSMSLYLVRLY